MKLILASLCAALLAGACASTGLSRDELIAVYRAHAGEPVSGFRMTSRSLQWRALSDDALVVWTRANEANLLEFSPRCIGLRSARTITISSSGGLVSARFDSVRITAPVSANHAQASCRISSIRPLDLQGINDTKGELRDAQTVARDPETKVEAEQPDLQ